MSMLSAQCDKLRAAAQTYRKLGNHSAESMLLDAADTIWKLRDDLQRAHAENAELRKLCADMWETITEHNRVTFAKLLRFGERLVKLGVIE